MDINKIQAELQDLAGDMRVKVKLNKHQDIALSSRETDNGYVFSFNPSKIRSPQKLENLLNDCRRDVTSLRIE